MSVFRFNPDAYREMEEVRSRPSPPNSRPRAPAWAAVLGCVLAVALLAVSVWCLSDSDSDPEPAVTVAGPRPSRWLEFYRAFERVPVEGREGFAVIKGGARGTGDPVLTSLIERFLNAKDPEVAGAARRLAYHVDTEETYTQSKKEVYMCLQDAEANNEYYSAENLAYVMAHEFAHAMMERYDPDHKTDEFHDKHERVLKSITTENFRPKPPMQGYCKNVPKPH
jgi:hypothetical protein